MKTSDDYSDVFFCLEFKKAADYLSTKQVNAKEMRIKQERNTQKHALFI